jgi:hypothetical protein
MVGGEKNYFWDVKDMVRRKINSLRGHALSIQLACLKLNGEGFQNLLPHLQHGYDSEFIKLQL